MTVAPLLAAHTLPFYPGRLGLQEVELSLIITGFTRVTAQPAICPRYQVPGTVPIPPTSDTDNRNGQTTNRQTGL